MWCFWPPPGMAPGQSQLQAAGAIGGATKSSHKQAVQPARPRAGYCGVNSRTQKFKHVWKCRQPVLRSVRARLRFNSERLRKIR